MTLRIVLGLEPGQRVGVTLFRAAVTALVFGSAIGCFTPQTSGVATGDAQTLRLTRPWAVDPLTLPPLPEDHADVREGEAGAPAVVLLDERTVTHMVDGRQYSRAPHTIVEVRRAMRLDHPDAVGAASVRIHLGARDELLDLQAETTTADGRTVPVPEAQAFDLARFPATTPDRAVVFAFPYAEPGAVVRWAYRVSHPGLRPLDTYRVPAGVPVRAATYTLRSYDFVELGVQRHGMTAERTDDDGFHRSWRWTVRDLPHAPPRAGDAPRPSGRASVRLAVRDALNQRLVRNWSDVLGPLLQRQLDLMPLLPASWPVEAPKGRPLGNAVRQVNRDLAPGATPLAPDRDDPEALHRFRRANAHERAGLVFALLTRWEAGCRMLATNGRGATPISAGFPMPIDDLRLLVQCGRWIYDPSCEGCGIGRLSPAVRGRYAIAFGLDDDEALAFDFRRLPAPAVPPIERGYVLQITDRGLVAEKGAVDLHDIHGDRVRRWLRDHPLPPDEAADAAATEFLDGIEASRIEVSGHQTPTGPVRFLLSNVLIARGGFTRGAGWALVPLDVVFGEPVFDLTTVEDRTRPVALHSDQGFQNTVSLPPAEGWTVARHPQPTTIESPFGTYRLTRGEGEGLVLVEQLALVPGAVEPGDWPALRGFLNQVADARQDPITLRRTP